MTGNDPTRSTSSEEEPVLAPRQEPDTAQQGEDPGYLTETGQAAGGDGSVAPIIGGLPAVEGRPGIPARRWTSAARAWLTNWADHQAGPVARTHAAAESRPAADRSGHDSAPAACAREGVP
jgi:hypothetical protein